MTSLARALLAELGPDDLAELAERLQPYLVPARAPVSDGWLDTKGAAAYLGVSTAALRHLVDRTEVPSHQQTPGGRHYFRRSELDAWRT